MLGHHQTTALAKSFNLKLYEVIVLAMPRVRRAIIHSLPQPSAHAVTWLPNTAKQTETLYRNRFTRISFGLWCNCTHLTCCRFFCKFLIGHICSISFLLAYMQKFLLFCKNIKFKLDHYSKNKKNLSQNEKLKFHVALDLYQQVTLPCLVFFCKPILKTPFILAFFSD